MCQSINGALACAPGMWRSIRAVSLVSVDQWRAGLRAASIYKDVIGKPKCQSINGALACAPALCSEARRATHVSVDQWRAGLRALGTWAPGQVYFKCQSINGALACAPPDSGCAFHDHYGVSRSMARWPARRESASHDG